MTTKREVPTLPADLVGHDAKLADLVQELKSGLRPDEDPLFINLARREAEKPPSEPPHPVGPPVYVDPQPPPAATRTDTFEMLTVRLEPELEEKRATTQRKLRAPAREPRASTPSPEAPSPAVRPTRALLPWVVGGLAMIGLLLLVALVAMDRGAGRDRNERPVASARAAGLGEPTPPSATQLVTPTTGAAPSSKLLEPVPSLGARPKPAAAPPSSFPTPSGSAPKYHPPHAPEF